MQSCRCNDIFDAVDNAHLACIQARKNVVNDLSENWKLVNFAVKKAIDAKALHKKKRNEIYNCLQAILDLKLDLNIGEPCPPLIAAIAAQDDTIISKLLDAGANPLIKFQLDDNKIRTAFGFALENNHSTSVAAFLKNPQIAKLVLEHRLPGGHSHLHYAISDNCNSSAKALLENNIDISVKDSKCGNTALHIASFKGQDEAIRLLVKHKAPINEVNNNNETPLERAIKANHYSTVNLLLDLKADISPQIHKTAEASDDGKLKKMISKFLKRKNEHTQKSSEEITSATLHHLAEQSPVKSSSTTPVEIKNQTNSPDNKLSEVPISPFIIGTNTTIATPIIETQLLISSSPATPRNEPNLPIFIDKSEINNTSDQLQTLLAPKPITRASNTNNETAPVTENKQEIKSSFNHANSLESQEPSQQSSIKNAKIDAENHTIRAGKIPYILLQVMECIYEEFKTPIAGYGGWLRDYHQNKAPKDYDLFHPASLYNIKSLLEKKFGNALACEMISGGVSHLNIYHSESKISIQISQLNNDHLEKLVKKLDFTRNSLVLFYPKFDLFDFLGAREDINNNILRTVIDANIRLEQNPLLILRGFYFTARDKLTWAPDFKPGIEKNKHLLRSCNPNSLLTELLKISDQPIEKICHYMKLMVEHKVNDDVFHRLKTSFPNNITITVLIGTLSQFSGNLHLESHKKTLTKLSEDIQKWFEHRDTEVHASTQGAHADKNKENEIPKPKKQVQFAPNAHVLSTTSHFKPTSSSGKNSLPMNSTSVPACS